jgi:hypothetical protein
VLADRAPKEAVSDPAQAPASPTQAARAPDLLALQASAGNKILSDAGLTREQAISGEFFYDYDIEVTLEPLEGAAPPQGGGSPTVVVPVPGHKDEE